MRKVVAAINTTIDGNCDHTAGIADEEIHQHYTNLLNNAGVIHYGRTTYQLMVFLRTILEKASEKKTMNDFCMASDKIQKIVFSHRPKDVDWKSAKLANRSLKDAVLEPNPLSGKDIFVGSRR